MQSAVAAVAASFTAAAKPTTITAATRAAPAQPSKSTAVTTATRTSARDRYHRVLHLPTALRLRHLASRVQVRIGAFGHHTRPSQPALLRGRSRPRYVSGSGECASSPSRKSDRCSRGRHFERGPFGTLCEHVHGGASVRTPRVFSVFGSRHRRHGGVCRPRPSTRPDPHFARRQVRVRRLTIAVAAAAIAASAASTAVSTV